LTELYNKVNIFHLCVHTTLKINILLAGSRLLGFYAVSIGKQLPSFQGIVLPSSSGKTSQSSTSWTVWHWRWRQYGPSKHR